MTSVVGLVCVQVQDLFETVDRAKREGGGGASVASMSSVGTSATAAAATVGGGGGLRRTMTSTVQSGGSGESRGESSSSVVTQTRPIVVKRSNGDEPVIKVRAFGRPRIAGSMCADRSC